MPRYITAGEILKTYNVSRQAVYLWRLAGKVRFIEKTGKYKYLAADVAKCIDAMRRREREAIERKNRPARAFGE